MKEPHKKLTWGWNMTTDNGFSSSPVRLAVRAHLRALAGATGLLLVAPGMALAETADADTATLRVAESESASSGAANAADSERVRLAQANTPSARRSSSDTGRATVEEVIVIARRREENLQTVPVSVTVVSQDTLRNNNVVTVENLRQLVPSMATSSLLSPDEINIGVRGQTASNYRPGVILYLNEVPLPADGSGNVAGGPGMFFDLENVQVLKGPQGTLFGRESVGGAVLLQSARPKNELGGSLQVGYGNYDSREIDAAINVPIIDEKLLTRFAFNGQKRDGYVHVLSSRDRPNGFDANDRDYWSMRGTVTFKPSDRFSNDLTATYQHFENNGSPTFLTEINPPILTAYSAIYSGFLMVPSLLAEQQALGYDTHIAVDGSLRSRGNLLSIANSTNVDLTDDLQLRTILGYTDVVNYRRFDNDNTVLAINNQPRTTRRIEQQQYTVEAQLLGKAFDGHLDWIAGAFALKQPFEPFYLQTGTTFGFSSDGMQRDRITSEALFAQGTYDLSSLAEGLKITGGVRYTWDAAKRQSRGIGIGTNCTSDPPVGCDESTEVTSKSKSKALTWTTGLDYQVTPETLIYLASRRGYRAGGANGVNSPVRTYDPEYVLDYELGLKSDWTVADRPVRTNVAVYLQDYTDIQTTRTVFDGVQFDTFTDNAAKAELWGAELEVLMRLTDNLEVGVTGAYLKFEFTGFQEDVTEATRDSLRSTEKANPSKTYTLSARYQLPLPETMGDLSMQANWSWQGTWDLTANGLGLIHVPSYGLLNGAVNWDGIAGGPIDASFFISNALNKRYITGGLPFLDVIGYNQERYGEPRMYGARVRYRFGGQ